MTSEPALAADWSGGKSPYAVSHLKLGMWLFIVGDAFTFAALFVGYGYLRLGHPEWPRPFDTGSILQASLMTFFLLSSSATMAVAVAKARKGDASAAVQHMVLTVIGGLLFLIVHALEWRHLIQQGASLFSNPWGVPLFTGCFFTITGMHMAHVASGLVVLLVIATKLKHQHATADHVEVAGLYWHFVDLVWMFIFPLIYLLSMRTR
ncbi:MAG: cytochrome c oxidase subunit 3 [Planctomycetes bacterium]|nr:cytochrome c oxidase subunit 3 [Planctomycetota bacterium]